MLDSFLARGEAVRVVKLIADLVGERPTSADRPVGTRNHNCGHADGAYQPGTFFELVYDN